MNDADKRLAEEAKRQLQDNALEIFSSKQKNGMDRNHKNLEKIKEYLKRNGGNV